MSDTLRQIIINRPQAIVGLNQYVCVRTYACLLCNYPGVNTHTHTTGCTLDGSTLSAPSPIVASTPIITGKPQGTLSCQC